MMTKLLSEYEDAKSGGEEWCPLCDEHYLPPYDYCKCVHTPKREKGWMDKYLDELAKDYYGGKYGKSTKNRK
jgi:hypothetical protein